MTLRFVWDFRVVTIRTGSADGDRGPGLAARLISQLDATRSSACRSIFCSRRRMVGLARGGPADGQPDANPGPQRPIVSPFGESRVAAGSGQHRAHRLREHADQPVSNPAAGPGDGAPRPTRPSDLMGLVGPGVQGSTLVAASGSALS